MSPDLSKRNIGTKIPTWWIFEGCTVLSSYKKQVAGKATDVVEPISIGSDFTHSFDCLVRAQTLSCYLR